MAGGAHLLARLPLVPERTALADQGRLEEAPLPEFEELADAVWEALGILEAASA